MRFDAVTGAIVDESIVGESSRASAEMSFHVMKNKTDEGYSVLLAEDVPQFNKCNVHLVFYNSKHEQQKNVEIPVDRTGRSITWPLKGLKLRKAAIVYLLSCIKIASNGTFHSHGYNNTQYTCNHVLLIVYVPVTSRSECPGNNGGTFHCC